MRQHKAVGWQMGLAVALLLILSTPLTASQSPNRWQGNPMLLTGPGSQIGVMLRDIVPVILNHTRGPSLTKCAL